MGIIETARKDYIMNYDEYLRYLNVEIERNAVNNLLRFKNSSPSHHAPVAGRYLDNGGNITIELFLDDNDPLEGFPDSISCMWDNFNTDAYPICIELQFHDTDNCITMETIDCLSIDSDVEIYNNHLPKEICAKDIFLFWLKVVYSVCPFDTYKVRENVYNNLMDDASSVYPSQNWTDIKSRTILI